jgi:triosephosphate isomerase
VSDWAEKSAISQKVAVGIQDISAYPAGSYTGAISGANLSGFNVKYCIVGHSERRKYFHESLEDIAKKVDQCLAEQITPIVCVDRQEIKFQADLIESSQYKKIIVAYEPVEYIGVGVAQDVAEVVQVINEIKKVFGEATIIYGGSVNADNVSEFSGQNEIEGYLVGSASLDAGQFAHIVKNG